MRVAFYSPLKPPNHWRPSGDRQLARLFARALAGAGCDVQLASTQRSWNGAADPLTQARDADQAAAISRQLIKRWRHEATRPDAWFTYHAYHKAPDWIGPGVCRSLDIPYVLAEASIAHKRAEGRWREGYRQTRQAVAAASAVISLNPDDEVALRELAPAQTLFQMSPFMEPPAITPAPRRPHGVTRLITIGMMRPGDKLESYRQLAATLAAMQRDDWQLQVIGDGKAGTQVQALFTAFGERVQFLGELDAAAVSQRLTDADLFVWPAHNEALGMALLEAHAHGLPAVAGYTPGVSRIVRDDRTGLVCTAGDTRAMAQAVDRLLDDPSLRQCMGTAARETFLESHTLAAASNSLRTLLARVAHG